MDLTYELTYLERNLLPLILSIEARKTESHIYAALGMEDRISTQSFVIQFGNYMEKFWNKVISDSASVKNLIETNNLIEIDGKNKQMDHLFESFLDYVKYYLECKCNVKFDSEKSKSSNKKIKDITLELIRRGNNVSSGYFIPVVAEVPQAEKVKYNNKGLEIYGVNWMIEKIEAPFTSDEYFKFLLEIAGPILCEKGF